MPMASFDLPPTGIIRAPGTNNERMRFQSRAWPGGPEMTS